MRPEPHRALVLQRRANRRYFANRTRHERHVRKRWERITKGFGGFGVAVDEATRAMKRLQEGLIDWGKTEENALRARLGLPEPTIGHDEGERGGDQTVELVVTQGEANQEEALR